MVHHAFQRRAPWALVCVCLWGPPGRATTIDTRPRPTILLTRSKQFIAQDAWNSLALYRFDRAEPVRRFPAESRINKIDVTVDQKLLVVACDKGQIGVWNIGSGQKIWWLTPSQSGLGYIYDVSFSANGKLLIACDNGDCAVVFNALTGEAIGRVCFPPGQMSIMSATLSPDGSEGAFLDTDERLFTFDTRTWLMHDTGLKGGRPVRYSSDGKYVALASNYSGSHEQLRVVAVKSFARKDVGKFGRIGHIKPTEDGSFLVCEETERLPEENLEIVGVEYHPGSGELKQVWKLPSKDAENRTDFDPTRMVGVSTHYSLVTRLIDLRTGKPLLTIDNSANYRPAIVTSSSVAWLSSPFVLFVGGILSFMLLAWFLASCMKPKRT